MQTMLAFAAIGEESYRFQLTYRRTEAGGIEFLSGGLWSFEMPERLAFQPLDIPHWGL